MTIADAVKRYLEIAGEFGKPVALASYGLAKAETEKLFAAWDEDYQINRFMLLTLEASPDPSAQGPSGVYHINGFDCTHVTFQPGIRELL
jgi:hypothetical protein